MRQSLTLVLVIFFAPVLVHAQRAATQGIPPMAVHPVAIAPAAPASHLAPVGGVATVHATPRTITGVHTTSSPSPRGTVHPASSPKPVVKPQPVPSTLNFAGAPVEEDDLGAPGLGFDYAHDAVVHPDARRHHFDGGLVPFVGGGIYVPYPVYMDNGTVAEPPDAEEGAPAEADQPAEVTAARPEALAVRSYAHSSAPIEQDSEYVFVRRDGTVFFAVAFTFDSADLRYITQEGFRKTVPLTSLDLAATQQFNEQRGLSPRLPS
jgi:hypothetical protein